MSPDHIVRDLDTLRAIYGTPSGGAVAKEVDYLHPHYQALIRAAPFAILATAGERFVDATPRGDGPGFVAIEDDHTLLLPDRRGNNRIDGLRNIVHDPRVALLFLVPGVSETLRVNGRAEISVAPDLLQRFIHDGKLPRSVLVIHVETVFFQCAKAIMRSELWNPDKHIARSTLPSNGTILADITKGAKDGGAMDGAAIDATGPARLIETMY